MNVKKARFNPVLKVLIIIAAVLILLFAFTIIFYNATVEDEKQYIPSDFTGYIKIDSLTRFYDNIIDLRASEIILSQDKLKSAYKALLDFRSSKFATNKNIASILNMKVNIVLKNNYTPIFIINLKMKSLLLRSTKFITAFIKKQKSFTLETINRKEKKYKIYVLTLESNKKTFCFTIYHNLLFFAFEPGDIDYIFDAKISGKNILDQYGKNFFKKRFKKVGMADVYFNTDKIVTPLTTGVPFVSKISEKIDFDINSAISFNISNEDIYVGTFTNYRIMDSTLFSLLKDSAAKLDVVKYLPNDTNLYTAINVKSFKDFYKLFLYLQDGQYDSIIEKADKACKVLFKIGIEEILFSWIGKEIGMCTSAVSHSPIVFLKIKDHKKLDFVIEKLTSSILLGEEEDLVFNTVELSKLTVPEFLQVIVRSFMKSFDTPYFIKIDDFVFFSMDPFALSNLANKHNDKNTLVNDKTFKFITTHTEAKGNVFVYFNIANAVPKFLQNKSFYSEILKLYEKGALSLNFNNSNLRLDLSAAGVNISKVKIFPGYPKKVPTGLSSPVMINNISGSAVNELLYTNKHNQFIAADINNNILTGFPAPFSGKISGEPRIFDLDNDGKKEIYIFTESGRLHRFDSEGKESPPYPIKTKLEGSTQFERYRDRLLFYSKEKKKLVLLKNKKHEEIDFELKKPLLAAPSLYKDIFALYPKSFDGTIHLINSDGDSLSGWPNDAGGIGFGSPVIADIDGGQPEVLFITQKGALHVWDMNGKLRKKLRTDLEGVYYCQVQVGSISLSKAKEIVALSKDGLVTILTEEGKIFAQKQIKEAASKERRMKLYDTDNDGRQEIYIYNGTNNLIALDEKLELLPGFPIKGSTEPYFTDFNSDGRLELVTSGIDDFIFIYTMP